MISSSSLRIVLVSVTTNELHVLRVDSDDDDRLRLSWLNVSLGSSVNTALSPDPELFSSEFHFVVFDVADFDGKSLVARDKFRKFSETSA